MDIPSMGGAGRRIFGVVIGVVTDNVHPEGEYRVKVKFPWIRSTDAGDDEDFLSSWARISTPMAGLERGIWFLPEVDDEVLVMFEHGDVRRPVVIGSLWNGKDLPPVQGIGTPPEDSTDPMGVGLAIPDACKDTKEGNGRNRARFIYSRSGHLLLFDDSDEESEEKVVLKTKRGHTIVLNDKSGNENIAIYDSKGDDYLYIDETNKKITLESKNGDIDILCKSGTLNIEAKDIKTKSSKTQQHESGSTWKQKAGSSMDIEASSQITVKGSKINLN
ncbi:MAG: phage baseplate assembly protein V [Myxococcota bacterium]